MVDNRAKNLLEEILCQGNSYFQNLTDNGAEETEILDFKRLSNNQPPLTDNDKKNLSKALGGFYNASGGLIVWGVDCRKNERGVDIANRLFPISQLDRFQS